MRSPPPSPITTEVWEEAESKLKPHADATPPPVDAKSWHPTVEQCTIVIYELKRNKAPDVGGWTTERKAVFLLPHLPALCTAWLTLRTFSLGLELHMVDWLSLPKWDLIYKPKSCCSSVWLPKCLWHNASQGARWATGKAHQLTRTMVSCHKRSVESQCGHPTCFWRRHVWNFWWSGPRGPSIYIGLCHSHVIAHDGHYGHIRSLAPNVSMAAHVDDTMLLGPAQDVTQAITEIQIEATTGGFKLQKAKTQVWSPTPDYIDNEPLLRALQGRMGDKRGTLILGETVSEEPEDAVPIGSEAFVIEHIGAIKRWLVQIRASSPQTRQGRGKITNCLGASYSDAPSPADFCTY